jgi:hypothetical protein
MAYKYLTSSAAVGTSGSNTKGRRITVSGDAAVGTVGTCTLLTGGAGGTAVWKVYLDGGQSRQYDLAADMVFDYVAISNVEVMLEYYKVHGV